MDDVRVGSLLRAIRIRKGWRQEDVARVARVSSSFVSLVESGRLDRTTLGRLRAIATALGATLDVVARWRGGDIDRLVNEGHSRLLESIAARLDSLGGWSHAPEVAFSIYGERGVIDLLAFHPASRSLAIIEVKTDLTDLANLLTVTSRRLRLGREIATGQGWDAATVSAWVVIAESQASRRLVRRFSATVRSAFPADGHAIRNWLARPEGRISALSFWSSATPGGAPQHVAARRRVHVRRARQTDTSTPSRRA